MIYGDKLKYSDDGKHAWLGDIEVIKDSIGQYMGRVHFNKYQPYASKDDDDLNDIWCSVQYCGSGLDDDIFYKLGNQIFINKEGNYFLGDTIDDMEQVYPHTIRQILPDIHAVGYKKPRLYWNGKTIKSRILLRGKYNPRMYEDNPYVHYSGATVYYFGDLQFNSQYSQFNDNYSGLSISLQEGSVEQLICEIPEIWVPIKYCAQPREIKHIDKNPTTPKINPDPKFKQCVYVFELEDGRIKIGITNNVERRMSAITGNSGLKITRHYETDFIDDWIARKIEKQMHVAFSKERIIREFFKVPFAEAKLKLFETFMFRVDEND